MSQMDEFSRRKTRLRVGEATIAYLTTARERPSCSCTAARSPHASGETWSQCSKPTTAASPRTCSAWATPRPRRTRTGRCERKPRWSSASSTLSASSGSTSWATTRSGAVAQLLAAHDPDRVDRLVLSNAEAYDNWPSPHERPYVRATQLPVLGRLAVWLGSKPRFLRWELASAGAVSDPLVLDRQLLRGYRPNWPRPPAAQHRAR